MNMAIIGGRDFNDYNLMVQTINNYLLSKSIDFSMVDYIISGGAKGADSLGEIYAREFNIKTIIFLPNWEKYNKSAGFIRNQDIINKSDIIFAFWDGKSKGTKHSINIATKQNKKIIITKYLKL